MAPTPRLPRSEYDWRYRNKTGGQVQGSPNRPGKRPSVADEVAAKAKDRADRNQKKKPPTDQPAGPRKSAPNSYTPPPPRGRYDGGKGNGQVQRHLDWWRDHPEAPPGDRYGSPKKAPKLPGTPKKPTAGGPVKGLTTRVPAPGSSSGRSLPKRPGTIKLGAQPGQGASGSGAGRDTPGAGKERGQFEKDRQGRMQGSGGDRPPVYKPKDDGQRGGYIGRSTKAPTPQELHDRVKGADEQTKQKIRDILDGKKSTSAPIPAPTVKKKLPAPGSNVVKGLTVRV